MKANRKLWKLNCERDKQIGVEMEVCSVFIKKGLSKKKSLPK